MRASRANDLDLVKLLVDKGADAKAVDANGRTALFYVVSEAKVDLKLVRFLCEAGVAVDAGEWGTGHDAADVRRQNGPLSGRRVPAGQRLGCERQRLVQKDTPDVRRAIRLRRHALCPGTG
ncbi:hypothetical protein DIPPA_17279 [Diplonema papillatum]|nr:hypothetical protein DIPPA_17279 [Diplonema papillatum]